MTDPVFETALGGYDAVYDALPGRDPFIRPWRSHFTAAASPRTSRTRVLDAQRGAPAHRHESESAGEPFVPGSRSPARFMSLPRFLRV